MKKISKGFSVLFCLILAFTFALAPMVSYAEPETTETTTSKTTKNTEATTKKTTTTTKKKTTTTTKKTTTGGKLSVSSKKSADSTGQGGKVDVIYTVSNTGDVTAKNIKIKDSDVAGSQIVGEIDSLGAGEKKEIKYTATMTRDSKSKPVVTCTMAGVSKTFTGETTTITLSGGNSLLSATLSTSSTAIQPNTPVKFSLVLKNDDTKAITEVLVKDYAGNAIKSINKIDAGSTTNVDFELKLVGDTNVYVNVTAKSSEGEAISTKSNELAMKADADAVKVTEGISLLITADKTELDKKGDVNLTLEVKNLMPKPFKNLVIVDKITNTEIQKINLLAANDTKTYTSKITIDKNTSFNYEVTATYEDGTQVKIPSNALEIKVGGKGLFSSSMTIIIIIVAVLVVLIIATSVTLFILSKKEKEKRKAMGASQSAKYRKSTPKKKSDDMVAPAPPLSTFTIGEDDMNMNGSVPEENTAPVQMGNNDAFDNYGNNMNGFNDNGQQGGFTSFTNNSQQSFTGGSQQSGGTSFTGNSTSFTGGSQQSGSTSFTGSSTSFTGGSQQSGGTSSVSTPEPSVESTPTPPPSNEPINYNDLDPD